MKKRFIIRNDEAVKPHKKIPSTFSDRVSKVLHSTTIVCKDASVSFPKISVKYGAQCALGKATKRGNEILSDKELTESGYHP